MQTFKSALKKKCIKKLSNINQISSSHLCYSKMIDQRNYHVHSFASISIDNVTVNTQRTCQIQLIMLMMMQGSNSVLKLEH